MRRAYSAPPLRSEGLCVGAPEVPIAVYGALVEGDAGVLWDQKRREPRGAAACGQDSVFVGFDDACLGGEDEAAGFESASVLVWEANRLRRAGAGLTLVDDGMEIFQGLEILEF